VYKHKVLFVIKLSLVLILGYAVIRTVLMPQHTGEIFVPNSAVGTENITAVEPTNFPDIPVEDYSAIVEQDIFGNPTSSLRTNKSLQDHNALGLARSTEEELGIALLGTVAGSPEISRAIIKDIETNVLSLYKTGDTVATAHIESIEKDTVVLLHQGRRKILNLGTSQSRQHEADNTQAASSKYTAQAAETVKADSPATSDTTVAVKLGDIETILKKAVIEPYAVDGQMEGLKITGLENIRGAKDLGLRNGDVMCAVNGHQLTSKQKTFQIFKKARSQAAMSVELLRDNKIETLSFSLR